jgi:hypothetical protein
MGGAFLGDDFGKSDQPVLGGDVGRLDHGCLLGMHRAHINDTAAAIVFVHFAQNRARGQEGAVEMNGEELLPFAEVKLVDRGNGLDSGIGDEDIDPRRTPRPPVRRNSPSLPHR